VDITDLGGASTVLAGVLVVVGIIGVVVPGLPGLLVVWAGVLLWAVLHGGWPPFWRFWGRW
jgi:uncharacterized protein YqgC (DUF456 family)